MARPPKSPTRPFFLALLLAAAAFPANAEIQKYLSSKGKILAGRLLEDLRASGTPGGAHLAKKFEEALDKLGLNARSELESGANGSLAKVYKEVQQKLTTQFADELVAGEEARLLVAAQKQWDAQRKDWVKAIKAERERSKDKESESTADNDPTKTRPKTDLPTEDPGLDDALDPDKDEERSRTTGTRNDTTGGYNPGGGSNSGAGSGSGDTGARAAPSGLSGGLGGAENTIARASGQGEALKNSARADDGGFAGGPDPGAAGQGPGSAAAALGASGGPGGEGQGGGSGAAAFNPANPQSPQELAMAAAGAFRESAQSLGMRAGTDANGRQVLLGPSGQPATPQEMETLRQRIQTEPAALVSNPNFFNPALGGIERQRFNDLKGDIKSRPDLKDTELKDLALTEKERDIARSKSCELASGDCNPSAEKSYKDGEKVPPKELNSIWSRIRSAWKDTAKKNREYREKLAAQNRSLFGGRDLAGRLKGLFGLGKPSNGSGASGSPASAEGGLALGGIPTPGSYDEAGAVGLSGVDYNAAAASRQRTGGRAAGSPGLAGAAPGSSARKWAPWFMAALGGLALFLALLLLRRKEKKSAPILLPAAREDEDS